MRLTREELNALAGQDLPERAAISLINAKVAAPLNAAIAASVLSSTSATYPRAQPDGEIDQSTGSSGGG
jgi:hypothetical protein